MKKTLIATAVAASVVAPISAHAVNVAHNKTGEVLLYPYYNVNEGNATFLSVTNTTNEYKVLKIRFREGVESEDVFDFQIWMSPYDHWSAAIAQSGNNIRVTTADTTCTVPTVRNNPLAVFNPQRIPSVYTGDVLTRMSEGHIEILEMGVLIHPGLQAAVLHDNGVPDNCNMPAGFNNDMAAAGQVIRDNGGPYLTAPTGGLYGLTAVFNPTDGTYFTYTAEAIEEFAATPIFYPQSELPFQPGSDHTADDSLVNVLFFDLPDISTPDGIEGAAAVNTINSYTYAVGGNVTVGTYNTDGVGVPNSGAPSGADAADAKRDAVTTSMMAYQVNNDYLTGDLFDTDWVFTFPGRYLYREFITSNAYDMEAPFTGSVLRSTGRGCQAFSENTLYGREEEVLTGSSIGFSPGTSPAVFSLCYEVNVIAMNDDSDGAYTGAIDSLAVRADATSLFDFGWADLVIGNHSLTDDAAVTHMGLPVIGFAAVTDRSSDVTRGGTFQHKITRGVTAP